MSNQNAIIVVVGDDSTAMNVSKTLLELIQYMQATHSPAAICAVIGVNDMRKYLQNQDVKVEIPEIIHQAERKLLVAFDTVGCDFLDELNGGLLQAPPETLELMRNKKFSIIPIAGLIHRYCISRDLTKIWVQRPVLGGFDEKLAQRLEKCGGIELYQLSAEKAKMADIHAVRAWALYDLDHDGKSAADRFWRTVHEEFEENKVQAALVGHGMSVLIEQGDKSMMPEETIDTHLFYMQSVVTWLNGDY